MPNDEFNIKTDLSIRYLNASLGVYVEIVADSFEVEIDRGIDIDNGVLAEGSIGTATIKLVKSNLSDFLGTPGYKASDPIEIRYRPFPDTIPSVYNALFTGNIQNVSMSYINESKTLEITITADDLMRKFQNTVLASHSVTGTVTQRSFRNCMTNLATALGMTLTAGGSGASGTTQRVANFQNETGGSIVSKFLDAELGWLYSLNNGTLSYLTRSDVATKQAIPYVSGNPTISNVHYINNMVNGNFETNTTGWTSSSAVNLFRDPTTFYNGVASMYVTTNYVTNSFFETNVTGWGSTPNTNFFRGTSFGRQTGGPIAPYSGTGFLNSVSIAPFTIGDWYIILNNAGSLPISAGVNYTVSARNITYWNTNIAIAINWFNGGTFIGQSLSPVIPSSNTSWQEITHSAVAPAGTTRAEIVGFTQNIGGGFEESGWDNFMLEQTASRNSSFLTQNLSTMSFQAADKVKGSVWVKNFTNTASAQVSITYYNSGGSPITTTTGAATVINSDSWTQVQATGVAPTGTVRAIITITGIKTSPGPGVMNVDNVKLENLTRIAGSHYCLDNIILNYDSDTLVNKCVVVDGTALTRTVASNATSITANGEQSGTFTVDFDPAGVSTYSQWATEVVNSATIKQVSQVTVPVIRDDGKASDIADAQPGNVIQVEFAQDPLPALQVVSIMSRVNHVITPQHWEMNIGLWRGI